MKKIILCSLFLFSLFSLFALPSNRIYKETFSNEIANLEFNLLSENLSIKEIYGDEITVEVYSNNKKNLPIIEENKKSLRIQAQKRSFGLGDYCDVEICIPQDKKFKNIKINQSSGTIKIEKLEAEKLSLRASSGSLEADYLSSDTKLILERTSGSSRIGTIGADEFLYSSSSGSCKIEKINSIDAILNTTSGSLKIAKLDTESFDISKSSGSADISNICADYFTVKSTSGSVSLEFENPPVATSKIETSSGSVKLYFLSKEGFNIEYSTSSGSFNDTINNNRFSPRGTYKEKFFGGGADIKVSTTSGSFTVGD